MLIEFPSRLTKTVAFGLALLVGACTGAARIPHAGGSRAAQPSAAPAPGPSPRRGGRIVFGFLGEPATLDPYSPIASDETWALDRPVYPSLYEFRPDGTPVAYLARHLRSTGRGARVTLRRARWSDGSRITAGDVAASFRRARAPSGFARIVSARALGEGVVGFRGHISDWPRTLATLAFVLPGGRVERDHGAPVAGGPFRMVGYRSGLGLEYARNPRWTLGSGPYLHSIEVRFVDSEDILIELLRRGRLDAASVPSTVNIDDRLDEMGLHRSDARGWESVLLRLQRSLTRPERVAVANAVDRGAVVAGLIRDAGQEADRLNPGPGSSVGPWSRLPAQGRNPDRRVQVATTGGDELLALVQRALGVQLDGVGIKTDLVDVDARSFYGPWRVRQPMDVSLERASGAPGLSPGTAAFRSMTALPIAELSTIVAWNGALRGIAANPTFEGPLWNAQDWWRGP